MIQSYHFNQPVAQLQSPWQHAYFDMFWMFICTYVSKLKTLQMLRWLTKQFSLLKLLLQKSADFGCLFTLIILLLGFLWSLLVENLLFFRSLQYNKSKRISPTSLVLLQNQCQVLDIKTFSSKTGHWTWGMTCLKTFFFFLNEKKDTCEVIHTLALTTGLGVANQFHSVSVVWQLYP